MSLPPLSEKNQERQHLAFVFGYITIKYLMQLNRWSFEAVSGSISAAVRTGWLQRIPIRYGLSGFQPTLAAAREFRANPSLVRPFGGPQSILPRFAVQTDCGNRRAVPLAVKEMPIEELRADDYRMIPGESYPVAYAYVDLGGNPIRILHKVNENFRKLSTIARFRTAIQNDELAVRILAPSAGKARAIADVFQKTRKRIAGPVEIEIVPEMQSWLA